MEVLLGPGFLLAWLMGFVDDRNLNLELQVESFRSEIKKRFKILLLYRRSFRAWCLV